MRLDEDKLETLRRWGEGLRQSGGEEYAAAGRAILMLIEEIEQLHIDLWHARQQLSRAASLSESAEEPEEPLALTLHERLHRVLRRDSDSFPGPGPQPVEEAAGGRQSDSTKTTPQSWIEGLRRQK